MSHFTKMINAAAASLGFTIVPFWRERNWELAKHLRQLFARYDISVVFDVGANAGQYRDFLRLEVGYTGWIFSFEPLPQLAAQLTARAAKDRRWRIFEYALGDQDSEKTIHVTRDSKLSSFLSPTTQFVDFLAGGQEIVKEIRVLVRRLDTVGADLLPDQNAKVYLKLDTQGYDLNVLRGGRRFLPMVVAVQSELSFIPIYAGMTGFDEALAEFRNFGLTVSSLHAVSRDRAMRLIEGDCVLLNSSHPSVAKRLNAAKAEL